MKNNRKVAIYFRILIKNQITQLKKNFKKVWKNLEIKNENFFNKDAIQPKDKVWNKQKQVKITYLWYFYIKTLVEDKFDNIIAAIINSRKNIDIDLIDKSKKKIYKEILEKNNNAKRNLDNNIIDKLIYIFF